MTGLSDEAVERLRAAANWPEFSSDRYRVIEAIGCGGMGTVFAAIDAALDREVAIKVSNAVAGADLERRLAAESRVLARLEHPGIVPVHDAGRLADGRLFYVMKRVQGRTLSEHLAHASDLSDRLRIFERVCEAVAFAHARRIVHRDLKPDNVMIGSFGEVMVTDWGVAKALDDGRLAVAFDERPASARVERAATNHGAVLGTPGFMAPEQARGDSAAADERADVYGLGAILLALLANDPASPARHGSPAHALARLTGTPRPLRSICARALAVAPVDRYPSAAELGADIARYRAGDAVQAHRESAIERTARISKRYRMPILLVLTYVIMRTLVAVFAGW
jgi:serine/threonine protein kinase